MLGAHVAIQSHTVHRVATPKSIREVAGGLFTSRQNGQTVRPTARGGRDRGMARGAVMLARGHGAVSGKSGTASGRGSRPRGQTNALRGVGRHVYEGCSG